jgi:hypothetical protein
MNLSKRKHKDKQTHEDESNCMYSGYNFFRSSGVGKESLQQLLISFPSHPGPSPLTTRALRALLHPREAHCVARLIQNAATVSGRMSRSRSSLWFCLGAGLPCLCVYCLVCPNAGLIYLTRAAHQTPSVFACSTKSPRQLDRRR